MSEHDVGHLVRKTFHAHQHLIEGAQERLAPAVRVRAARRRRAIRVTAAGVAAFAVLIAVAVAPLLGGEGGFAPRRAAPASAGSTGTAPAGWRWESSLGAEIAVPGDWGVNDFGCLQTGRSSVVRGLQATPLCLTPEPTTKELAIFGARPASTPGATLPEHDVSIDGVPASRAEGQIPDGRYAGSITVPSRHVAVTVRTRDAATTAGILDSFRLVSVDHLGCAVQRPAATEIGADVGEPSTGPFVPADPSSIDVCFYGDQDRLLASGQATGDEAQAVAAAMNAAKPGLLPSPYPDCEKAGLQRLAMLTVHTGAEEKTIWATFGPCASGLDDGTRQVQFIQYLAVVVIKPVYTGIELNSNVPGPDQSPTP
jgi:hypothetical protein